MRRAGNEVPVEETDNAEAVLWGQVRVHAENGRSAVCVCVGWGGAEQWFRVRRGRVFPKELGLYPSGSRNQ